MFSKCQTSLTYAAELCEGCHSWTPLFWARLLWISVIALKPGFVWAVKMICKTPLIHIYALEESAIHHQANTPTPSPLPRQCATLVQPLLHPCITSVPSLYQPCATPVAISTDRDVVAESLRSPDLNLGNLSYILIHKHDSVVLSVQLGTICRDKHHAGSPWAASSQAKG